MKKIGIMTFHRALNFGAKLQAFALMETLNKNNFDASILDYRCNEIENFYYGKKGLKGFVKKIIFPRFCHALNIRKKNFSNFDKLYKTTKVYTAENIQNSNEELDAFVVGSDQVWNPIITGNDYNYFLPFADKSKSISYAASFGKAKISDWDEAKLHSLFDNFNGLLTREESAANMINAFDNKFNASAVLDPVFLLDKNDWVTKLNLKVNPPKQKYIFVYIVAQQTNLLERAKKIATEKNLKVIFVDSGRKADRFFTKENTLGPIEFLNLLLNAELVITTSFHALAFSLIFNVPFQYELSKEKVNANSRLSDIAKNLDIEQFELLDVDSQILQNYNWAAINNKIGNLKEESIKKLINLI